jgi:hypothetical protein
VVVHVGSLDREAPWRGFFQKQARKGCPSGFRGQFRTVGYFRGKWGRQELDLRVMQFALLVAGDVQCD